MSGGAEPATALKENSRVEREEIRVAYGTWVQYVDGRAFAILLTILMCGAAPDLGRTSPLVGGTWLAFDILWSVAALAAAFFYFRSERSRSPTFWRRVLTAIWITNALMWAAGIVVFWDPGNAANEAVLCTIVLAIMVSYFYTLAPCLSVLVAALSVLFAVTWLQLLLGGGALAPVFLVILPCFFVVLVNYSRQVARKYREALKLRFENEVLALELMKANQAKSSFLASISHELRTPLNAILGYSDMIRERTFGPIAPARYAGYIDDIHTSGTQLLRMINDLIDLGKIESGKREFAFAAVSLSKIAHEAMKGIQPEAERALVNIMLDIKTDIVVRADARAVKQMIANILSNAVKFSRPGGIAVIFCDVAADDRVVFGVKDTGLGMTPETLRNTLEPTAQGSDAYTVEGRGTGLGLPIVRGLVEAHRGQLQIESTPGAGSKVWVEFPPERLLRRAEAA
jgi:two-component system, cell cycle sensor histidine kinase PleC